MKIAPIGIAGRIGSRLAAELLARGHDVIGIARARERAGARPGVTAKQGNATKPSELAPLIAGRDAIVSASRFQTSDAASLIGAAKHAGIRRLLVDATGRSWNSMEDFAVAFVDELGRPRHSRQRFAVGC